MFHIVKVGTAQDRTSGVKVTSRLLLRILTWTIATGVQVSTGSPIVGFHKVATFLKTWNVPILHYFPPQARPPGDVHAAMLAIEGYLSYARASQNVRTERLFLCTKIVWGFRYLATAKNDANENDVRGSAFSLFRVGTANTEPYSIS